ncbi:MAG: type IV secretion system protein [Phyllobacterium sp.]
MDGANYIAALSANIDSLGKDFTAATYGAFAAYLTPVASGLFVLYLIFWGFQFWQGQGDGRITAIVFRLLRVAMIFTVATQWGQVQLVVYRNIVSAPYLVGSVMLNHIVNPRNGKAMGFGTVANDLGKFYEFAVKASAMIEREASLSSAMPPPPQPPADGKEAQPLKPPPPPKADDSDPLGQPLKSSLQAAIVWVAAALFVGYAVAILFFAKMALWVVLAMAPIFIIVLMFRMPSRFFSGWLSGAIQIMLIPVFLSAFLGFYMVAIQDIVIGLARSAANGSAPAMKDVAPFVLVCLSGLFLLTQIVPLTGRIASSTQEWAATAFERLNGMAGSVPGAGTRGLAGPRGNFAQGPQSAHEASSALETGLREIQDRNAAVTRQNRNR